MYEYENSYRTEIKSLVGEAYEWGGVDAYTELWDKVQAMKEAANKKNSIGFTRAVEQMEVWVDMFFNWSGAAHHYSDRAKVQRRRMRNADNAIDNLIADATKAGYLVPRQKRVS